MQNAVAMVQGGDSAQGWPPFGTAGRTDQEQGQPRMARASAVEGPDSVGPRNRRSVSERRAADRNRWREIAALATLDKFSRGILLIDCDGRVVFANRSAQAMVERKDGLDLLGNRLRFKCESTQAALESFLAGQHSSGCASAVLRTTGRSTFITYRVLVSRLEHGAGYSVFVYEPNGGHRPVPVTILRQLYGLTPAEVRLTNELFGGRSLAEAAVASGISINTAKSVLMRIFVKCAVGSQTELLLLLSLGPRTL